MKTRSLALLLVLALALGLCACAKAPSPKDPDPTPTPTPSLSAFEQWQERMLGICNMEYDGFAAYWDIMCDRCYGDSLTTVLEILSGGAKPFLPLDEKDEEIEKTRAEYAERYGEDWCFSLKELETNDLGEDARTDFAAELNNLADSADILIAAADAWNDAGWSEFALDHGCSVADAKRLVEAYREISAFCRDASVTEAVTVTVLLELTGENTEPLEKHESYTVYLVNGVYVTEPLIDYSYALINLVF